MDVAPQARRRKACDFCVSRKIRCDAFKPICSNCRIYGAECKITTAINTGRKRQPPSFEGQDSPSTPSNSEVESRLANIEAQLSILVAERGSPASLEQQQPQVEPTSSPHEIRLVDFPETKAYMASDMWSQNLTLPCLGFSPRLTSGTITVTTGQLELPPLCRLLPTVDKYFQNYNRYFPLFDQPSFLRMILDSYSSPQTQRLVPWAAINVVLAITYRILEDRSIDDPELAACIRNVQSATTDLMAWNEDLLGLQVLLAMVVLFQGTTNPQLAIVLIGSSTRLVQSMGLPSQHSTVGLSSAAIQERRRIFWIAYVLDRDLALRAKAPYSQIDAEMDIDLPAEEADSDLGIFTSSIDGTRFNYLLARVELANIQGKLHDLLYSKRARKLSDVQRLQGIARIHAMLIDWRDSIPTVLLTAEGLHQRFGEASIPFMTNIFNRHLECLLRLHSLFSFDEAWLSRARAYLSSEVIQMNDHGVDHEVVRSNLSPLPDVWNQCVQLCRSSLGFMSWDKETEYSLWLHACCAISALIILFVNTIEYPDNESIALDQRLVDKTRSVFEQMNAKASKERFFLLKLTDDLDRRAKGQVNRISELNNIWFMDEMET